VSFGGGLSLSGLLIIVLAHLVGDYWSMKGITPPPLSWTWRLFFINGPAAFIQLMGIACWFVADLTGGAYVAVALDTMIAGGCLWHWWKTRDKNGGRKKKALKALGEKSRAKLQELADKVKPIPAPLPSRI